MIAKLGGMADSLNSTTATTSKQEDTPTVSEEDDDNKRAVVFQCVKCREIVGDSLAWVCANSEMRTVTLQNTTSKVTVCDGLMTSSSGSDLGSTYSGLKCERCSSTLGRMYRTTPRQLDELRDLYTLDVEKLEGYQVGEPSLAASSESSVMEDLISVPQARNIMAELTKVKSLMIVLNNRVCALERCVESQTSVQNDDTANSHSSLASTGDSVTMAADSRADLGSRKSGFSRSGQDSSFQSSGHSSGYSSGHRVGSTTTITQPVQVVASPVSTYESGSTSTSNLKRKTVRDLMTPGHQKKARKY